MMFHLDVNHNVIFLIHIYVYVNACIFVPWHLQAYSVEKKNNWFMLLFFMDLLDVL